MDDARAGEQNVQCKRTYTTLDDMKHQDTEEKQRVGNEGRSAEHTLAVRARRGGRVWGRELRVPCNT